MLGASAALCKKQQAACLAGGVHDMASCGAGCALIVAGRGFAGCAALGSVLLAGLGGRGRGDALRSKAGRGFMISQCSGLHLLGQLLNTCLASVVNHVALCGAGCALIVVGRGFAGGTALGGILHAAVGGDGRPEASLIKRDVGDGLGLSLGGSVDDSPHFNGYTASVVAAGEVLSEMEMDPGG